MGWSAGSELAQSIWDKIREYIPEENRKEIATFIYDAVCDLDADDWDGESQLEIDAELPVSCWSCDKEFLADELDKNGLCTKCAKER